VEHAPTAAELNAMRAALRLLPGWTVRAEIAAYERSLRVFVGNDRELAGFLGEAQEPANAVQLWAVENREGFEHFLDEFDRLLHNLLSSAVTLRDHARRLRRKLLPAEPGDDRDDQYQARIDTDFVQSPLAQFVEDLRHFTLHRRLPVATGGLSVVPGESFETRIILHPSDLLKSSGWGALAKRYIESAGDEIVIADALREYRPIVVDFHEWFCDVLRTRHADDLRELDERETTVRDALQRAWGPPPSDWPPES
jgi:hypothetical protein